MDTGLRNPTPLTPGEFCSWLDGYLLDRAEPDYELIKSQARKIRTPSPAPPVHVPPPLYGAPLLDSARPPWPGAEPQITCVTHATDACGYGRGARSPVSN